MTQAWLSKILGRGDGRPQSLATGAGSLDQLVTSVKAHHINFTNRAIFSVHVTLYDSQSLCAAIDDLMQRFPSQIHEPDEHASACYPEDAPHEATPLMGNDLYLTPEMRAASTRPSMRPTRTCVLTGALAEEFVAEYNRYQQQVQNMPR